MLRRRSHQETGTESSFDLSISDLMAALLLIMILVLSATLLNLQKSFEEKRNIAERYDDIRNKLYEDLLTEFKDDLEKWNAEIYRDNLTVRFKEPDVLFEPNSTRLKEDFKRILEDFFPRYIEILRKDRYLDSIEEIRIEGHSANPDKRYDYFDGMNISQGRTNNVLFFLISDMENNDNQDVIEWVKMKIIASGFSHSRPVLIEGSKEPDWEQSRRVEFRVKTDADKMIQEMLDIGR